MRGDICYSFLASKVLSFLAGPPKRECCEYMMNIAARAILLLQKCPEQLGHQHLEAEDDANTR